MSIQTSSTLSSLGSKSTSIPDVVSTTKKKQHSPWYHSVWLRSIGHVIAFALLFMASFISLRLHSLGRGVWKNAVYHASTQWAAPVHTLGIFGGHATQRSTNLGVSFQRTITDFPQDSTSSFTLLFEDAERHCGARDEYGPNNCHYDWKESVVGSYHVDMPAKVLNETANLEVTMMLDNRVPYKLECPLCGQDCVLEIPVFKVHYTIPNPPCPVSLQNRSEDFEFQLWRASPTDGWLTIPVSGSGKIYEAPGIELASFDFHLTAR
jgi:hypothetical protein